MIKYTIIITLLLTTLSNAGKWTEVTTLPTNAEIQNILPVSNEQAFLQTATNELFYTENYGDSWRLLTSFNSKYELYFPDAMKGYGITKGGSFISTIDGGKTWKESKPPFNYKHSFDFIDSVTAYVIDDENSVYKTENCGKSAKNPRKTAISCDNLREKCDHLR